MGSAYAEEYARKKGISVEEAMEHYIVKEYLKYHPEDMPDEAKPTETKTVAGCGSAVSS